MKAIVIEEHGAEDCMQIGEAEAPAIAPGALRIEIHAAGVNRADLMQRQGLYPPPPGAPPTPGQAACSWRAEAPRARCRCVCES